MKTILSLALLLATVGCQSQPPSQPASNADPSPGAASSSRPAQAPAADPASVGSIAGTVSFKGAPPRQATLDMTADPMCPQTPQPSDTVMIKNGKVANVFVYVKEGAPAGPFAPPAEPVVLDQKNCRYTPHMMGVVVKQPFKIMNDDQADHNIHDMPAKNAAFNESQMPTDKPIFKTFSTPEMMIALQCNQHPWMRAYVNVMAHPFYAVTSDNGSFEIKNLPPGEYTLAAVHEKFGEKTIKVKVTPKQTAKADFEFSSAK
jgi:hypothetical protein